MEACKLFLSKIVSISLIEIGSKVKSRLKCLGYGIISTDPSLSPEERLKKLSDIADLTEFFFTDKLEYPKELLAWKKMSVRDAQNNLQTLYAILLEVNEKKWQAKNLEKTLVKYIKSNDLKVGEYLWPLRVALTGRKASPGPFEVADILGKSTSLERIRQAIQD